MPYSHSFPASYASARGDGIPWVEAEIVESASFSGTYTPAGTVPWNDPDPESTEPTLITINDSELEVGYFKMRLLTADGVPSPWSDPVFSDSTTGATGPFRLGTSIEQLRRRLHANGGGQGAASDNELLSEILQAAESRIMRLLADRTLYPQNARTKTISVFGSIVRVPDLRAVESIRLDGVELDADTGYQLSFPIEDDAGAERFMHVRLLGWCGLRGDTPSLLTINGDWGPADIDVAIRDAALTWAARAWHARAARFADAVADPAGGVVSSYFKAVPADVGVVLNSYRIPGF